jgi:hypothetical protein
VARSDLLLSIVRAGASGDRNALRSSVEAIVAEERGKNHHILADRLQRALNAVSITPPATPQPGGQSGKDTILESTPHHAELLDRAVWRRFQLRLAMPQPSHEALAVFLDRQFDSWPEPAGIEAERLANQLGQISFAEALEFCQTVRRQHILSLGDRTLRDIRPLDRQSRAGRSRCHTIRRSHSSASTSQETPADGGRAAEGSQARKFDRGTQARAHGPIFQRLQTILNRPDGVETRKCTSCPVRVNDRRTDYFAGGAAAALALRAT